MVILREIMVTNVITIEHDKSAQDAAKLMAEHNIGSLVVIRDGGPIGIVTERDLVRKVCTRDIPSSRIPLQEVMSSPLISTEPDMTIETAVQRMVNKRIRRLPILDKGKIVGIVTETDLVKHLRTTSLIEKIFE